MRRVRAFEERDIPQVAALHSRVFPPRDRLAASAGAYDAYFREIFLTDPWRSGGTPSLVYEDGADIVGFLGVNRRRMMLDDGPIWMAASSQFIVDPLRRTTLAGIELIRALLDGPQDLTVADEAIDVSRRLWEGLGGATASLYSLSWVRVLRPFEFGVRRWGRNGQTAAAWVGASRLADAVAACVPGSPFRPAVTGAHDEDLSADRLADCLAEFTRDRVLRPAYDGESAGWLLAILARKPGAGTLRKRLVRAESGEIAGWYLYSGGRGGLGEVIQVGARGGMIGIVLDHLWAQARRDGVAALVGRLDPRYVRELTARHCFFHHRGYWTLVHARDPRLLETLDRGDAFLTRLEGEWCLRFQLGVA